MTKKRHYLHHRERVRARFRQLGLDVFREDYEVLELLLMFAIPVKDVKPIAKELVSRFGSFKEVLDAPEEELLAVEGVGPVAATMIRFVKGAATRYLQQKTRTDFTLDTPESLIDYCIACMGAQSNEQFRVIYLDGKFAIVDEQLIAEGTIDQAAVYPRKVMEHALKSKASNLVFVHNHPDGNVTPSEFDKTLTRGLVLAAKTMSISVYDHIIVSQDAHFSFRENDLL